MLLLILAFIRLNLSYYSCPIIPYNIMYSNIYCFVAAVLFTHSRLHAHLRAVTSYTLSSACGRVVHPTRCFAVSLEFVSMLPQMSEPSYWICEILVSLFNERIVVLCAYFTSRFSISYQIKLIQTPIKLPLYFFSIADFPTNFSIISFTYSTDFLHSVLQILLMKEDIYDQRLHTSPAVSACVSCKLISK
jgi:hypothetical protein